MVDPHAALTEFRSLDEKRNAFGLSADEELRWSELREALATPDALDAPEAQPQIAEEYPGWRWDAEQQQWVPHPGGEVQEPEADLAAVADANEQGAWNAQDPSEQAAWTAENPDAQGAWTPPAPIEQAAWDAELSNAPDAAIPQAPAEQAAWAAEDPDAQQAWTPQDPNEQAAWTAEDPSAQNAGAPPTLDPAPPAEWTPQDPPPQLDWNVEQLGSAQPETVDDSEVTEVDSDDVVSIGDDGGDPAGTPEAMAGSEDPTLVDVADVFAAVDALGPAVDALGPAEEPTSVPEAEIPFAAEAEVLETDEEQPVLEPLPEEQVIEATPDEIVDQAAEEATIAPQETEEILAVDALELEQAPEEEEEELALTDVVMSEPPRPLPTTTAAPAPQLDRAGTAIGGLNPSWVDGEHRVAVHTIEGQVKRGIIRNADLLDDSISLDPVSGVTPERIPTARVKAIFFMLPNGATAAHGSGRKMRITFHDGRQVMGFADDYSTHDPGFFLTPAEGAAHADRIFIYRASVRSVAEA